jgi:secreted trypsin-like serine protease
MRKMILFSLLAAGCGAATDEASEQSIQGGSADKADPAVGLVWFDGGGFCTGSLIAPNVVLTAGHCVEQTVASFYTGAGKATENVGPLPVGKMARHTVVDQIAHPSYRSENVCPNSTFDVGLLRLEKPIANAKLLALGDAPPKKSEVCKAVGYGMHDTGGVSTAEQKRRATETVESKGRTSLRVVARSGIVDHGDSGGPLLCGAKIVGTTSCGNDGSGAAHTEAYYARTDGIRDWIDSVVASWQ